MAHKYTLIMIEQTFPSSRKTEHYNSHKKLCYEQLEDSPKNEVDNAPEKPNNIPNQSHYANKSFVYECSMFFVG